MIGCLPEMDALQNVELVLKNTQGSNSFLKPMVVTALEEKEYLNSLKLNLAKKENAQVTLFVLSVE